MTVLRLDWHTQSQSQSHSQSLFRLFKQWQINEFLKQLLFDTARIVMQSRVYETVFRRFFRLSIPAVDCCSSMWCVCCCGPSRHVISIDYCTAWLQQVCPPFGPYLQQSAANASCVVFPATVEGWTQTCDFMFILLYMLWLSGASAACVSISFVCTLHCLSDYVGRTSLKLPVCVECNVKPLTQSVSACETYTTAQE